MPGVSANYWGLSLGVLGNAHTRALLVRATLPCGHGTCRATRVTRRGWAPARQVNPRGSVRLTDVHASSSQMSNRGLKFGVSIVAIVVSGFGIPIWAARRAIHKAKG